MHDKPLNGLDHHFSVREILTDSIKFMRKRPDYQEGKVGKQNRRCRSAAAEKNGGCQYTGQLVPANEFAITAGVC